MEIKRYLLQIGYKGKKEVQNTNKINTKNSLKNLFKKMGNVESETVSYAQWSKWILKYTYIDCIQQQLYTWIIWKGKKY